MNSYYSKHLSAGRLAECYNIAPPRVQQYLQAEVEYCQKFIKARDLVLELGCGYGRALKKLAETGCTVIGIDISFESLVWGRRNDFNFPVVNMDASRLGFRENTFDLVFCIQNGVSAIKIETSRLIIEALRVTKSGGCVILSSYSDRFWDDRLDWFRIQSQHHLIGEIDEGKTGSGSIVCKDGFSSNTCRPGEILSITERLNVKTEIVEVDNSSMFFVINGSE